MFHKFKILSLALSTLICSTVPSSKPTIALAANVDKGYTSTNINIASLANRQGTKASFEDPDHPLEHIGDVLGEYTISYHYKDLLFHNEALFGNELWALIQDNSTEEEQISEYCENIYFAKCNSNIYFSDRNSEFKIGFEFNNNLLKNLRSIAQKINYHYTIPCLTLDGEVFSFLDIHEDSVSILTLNHFVSKVELGWSKTSYIENMMSVGITAATDVVFTIKGNSFESIKEIGILSYDEHGIKSDTATSYNYESDYHIGYVEDGFKIYVPRSSESIYTIVPYEVSYFNYGQGHFVLSHSIYGERYGSGYRRRYLSSISLKVVVGDPETRKSRMHNYVLPLMSHEEYQMYRNQSNYSTETVETTLKSKITSVNRDKLPDEIEKYGENNIGQQMGQHSLIVCYLCPFVPYSIDKVSSIEVTSMSFFDYQVGETNTGLYLNEDDREIERFNIPSGSMKYKYMADEVATGLCSANVYELNMSGTKTVETHFSWWLYLTVGLLTGGVGCLGMVAGQELTDAIASSGTNIQRFYFNMYKSDNQIISNIKKLEFAYQYGLGIHKEPNIIGTRDDGTMIVGMFKDLPSPNIERIESENNSSVNISAVVVDITIQKNGFFTCEDEPANLNGKSYNYFYQNIYHTSDYTINGQSLKAYNDYICAWTPLSIWYEHTSGSTIRLTTNKEGYYLSYDEYGQQIVVSVDDPYTPTDITPEEFLNSDFDVSYENYDAAERNDFDKVIDNIVNFFSALGSYLKDGWDKIKEILGYVLIALFVVLVIFVIYKIVSFFVNVKRKREIKKASKEAEKINKKTK